MADGGLTAGVIGLGSMGLGAALSLARAGPPTLGLDLRAEAMEALASAGGTPAATPPGWRRGRMWSSSMW